MVPTFPLSRGQSQHVMKLSGRWPFKVICNISVANG
jgi:hypothetical protein